MVPNEGGPARAPASAAVIGPGLATGTAVAARPAVATTSVPGRSTPIWPQRLGQSGQHRASPMLSSTPRGELHRRRGAHTGLRLPAQPDQRGNRGASLAAHRASGAGAPGTTGSIDIVAAFGHAASGAPSPRPGAARAGGRPRAAPAGVHEPSAEALVANRLALPEWGDPPVPTAAGVLIERRRACEPSVLAGRTRHPEAVSCTGAHQGRKPCP